MTTTSKPVNAEIARTMRDKYVRDHELTHAEYYAWVAKQLGEVGLLRIMPFEPSRIRTAHKSNPHMNNLPLAKWDACDPYVRRLAARAGFPAWSLSDTVCVLKALAVAEYCRKFSIGEVCFRWTHDKSDTAMMGETRRQALRQLQNHEPLTFDGHGFYEPFIYGGIGTIDREDVLWGDS